MANPLTRAATTLYRRLPLPIDTRRRIKRLLLAPLTRGRPRFVFPWRGMQVMLDPAQSMDMRLFFDGDYEPDTLAAIARLAPAGGTVIDVGANIGLVSLWAARCVGAGGRVIAIEPSRWAMERLAGNARLNGMANIDRVLGAASDHDGDGTMFVINGYRVDDTVTNTHECVAFHTVDRIVADRQLARVDLIKTDTDGYELDVLRGAARTLHRFRPAIIFELGPSALDRAGSNYRDLVAFIHALGYAIHDEHFAPVDALAVAASVRPNESVNLIACDPDRLTPRPA